jgi:hypothetical protein
VIQFRKGTDITLSCTSARGPCRTATSPTVRVAYRGDRRPRFGSGPDEIGVAVRIVSYSVTTTTPGAGSSITSMIVSLTGTGVGKEVCSTVGRLPS